MLWWLFSKRSKSDMLDLENNLYITNTSVTECDGPEIKLPEEEKVRGLGLSQQGEYQPPPKREAI